KMDERIDRKWISVNRLTKEYEDEVKSFVRFASENAENPNHITDVVDLKSRHMGKLETESLMQSKGKSEQKGIIGMRESDVVTQDCSPSCHNTLPILWVFLPVQLISIISFITLLNDGWASEKYAERWYYFFSIKK
ncbi:hypothetical protein Lal_00031343, partial [Lupinus albus]